MPQNPLLSIITINLNNLEGLKKTIESVLAQTWQDFEYIVIDGGSNDGSKELIKSRKEQLKYWISEPDSGIYNAMNKGIIKSSGKYLLFLNSGDHLKDDDILEKIKDRIENQDLIYFDLEMYDDNKRILRKYPDHLTFSFFLKDSLPHPATFIKRELLLQEGLYDESYKIISDWKFFIDAVCKNNCSYTYVNECLTEFNLYGISSTEKMRMEMYRERKKFLEENYPAFLKDYEELENFGTAVRALRKSRKIKLLQKFKILNKF